MAEDVHGLQDLLKSMEALPLALQKRLIVHALRKGAEPIRERAEQLAPDDPATPGSRIKEGVVISVTEQTADGAIAKIGTAKGKAFVGKFAEFGSAHQAATPFLRPAIDEKQEEALKSVGEVLADGIEKEFKKR